MELDLEFLYLFANRRQLTTNVIGRRHQNDYKWKMTLISLKMEDDFTLQMEDDINLIENGRRLHIFCLLMEDKTINQYFF
jgi:hypothetical protein